MSDRSTMIVSAKPIALPASGGGGDLLVRVTAPATGHRLPAIVFSHGYGSSMDGYGPLVDHWASRGFAVLQPTHLDSRTIGLPADDPRTPRIWRIRVDDLVRVIDAIDVIAAAVPGLADRLDRERVAVSGHSWGAQTASALLGARVLGADGSPGEDMADPRVRAGVLLAVPGRGGEDLSPFAAEHFPFMHPSFETMTAPALVVAGDADDSPLTTRGPDWFTDAYFLSPSPKSLLSLPAAEHSLGGIAGHDSAETTDADPERVELIQRLTTAYLRTALDGEDAAWKTACADLESDPRPLGSVQHK